MSLSINRICVRILLPNNKYFTNKSIVIFTANFFYHSFGGCIFHIHTRTPSLFTGWMGNNSLTGWVNFSFLLQKQTNSRTASFYFNVEKRPFAFIHGIGRVTYGWKHLHFPYYLVYATNIFRGGFHFVELFFLSFPKIG